MSNIQTYTLSEFLQMTRAKTEIRDIGAEEYIAKKIMSNRKAKAAFTFVAATLMYTQKAFADTDINKALKPVNTAGNTGLVILQTVGYWIAVVMCLYEILKCLLEGNTKEIGKIIIKYLLAFSALYFLPWAFNIVRGIFSTPEV